MPVVTEFSPDIYGVLDANGILRGTPDYRKTRAGVHVTQGTITNAAGDESGSKYRIAKLPSSVILLPESVIDLQSWGFVIAKIGLDADTDALLSVADTTALSDVSSPIAHGDSRWGKELWEQLGLAEDPAGDLEISIHTEANAAGAGTATFALYWAGN